MIKTLHIMWRLIILGGVMPYIDMHCDTLELYASKSDESLFENTKSIDIKRLKNADAKAQFFAIWMPDEETIYKEASLEDKINIYDNDSFWWREYSDEKYFYALYNGFKECIKEHNDIIVHTASYDDYIENINNGKLSAFLTVEDGRIVEGKLERIEKLKELGVSLITLTWNTQNCFGAPNSFDKNIMNEGLTKFGIEAVECMQDKGIIVDVSHLSDGGFYDVADICRKSFVASHSNARVLSPHPRNLTDDMIRILGERGGAIGLNFCPYFLNKDINNKASTVEGLCAHALHIADKGGIDVVALGSDLDGIEGDIEIDSVEKMHHMFHGLKKVGFNESEIDKIMYKNAERIVKEVL